MDDSATVDRMEPAGPPDIRIDKEGTWYYRDTEMFRKDILQSLYRHLKQDPGGRYLIEIGEDRAYVDVEDTPYVVQSVSYFVAEGKGGDDGIGLHMPDGIQVKLDPTTLRVGADNALYGIMAGLDVEARFSRSSYYQLAKYIEFDEEQHKFYICLNSHRYYIEQRDEV
jgi:hypothetical protein